MTPLIEWLLDLDNIRLGSDEPLILRWDSPMPAWFLWGFVVAALTWIVVVYKREQTSAARRIALASLRCAIVALVTAVICRPSLVLQRNRVEPSHVALVVDASLSMAATEPYHDNALAQSVAQGAGLENPGELATRSRLQLVQAAFTRDDAAPLRWILERNAVQLWTFSGTAEPEGFFASAAQADDLVAGLQAVVADGPSTELAGAISQAITKAQGRRLAAVVLASDGQSTQPTSLRDAIDLARDRQVPVFALRIGSPDRPRDIELESVRAQETVFLNDIIAVEVQLTGQGLAEATPLTVLLIDEQKGDTVASQDIVLDPAVGSATVELRTKPSRAGTVRYSVEVPPLPGEVTTENNAVRLEITVLDNRVRILFVDGYPRYEYRYLKNALLREQTVELSVLLIEADERFVQEGTDPIRRFPSTPEELNRYDVVLFGDVDPRSGWLTPAQMNMLLDFVGNEGGGFGLIAGERASPHRFQGTPLEKLIPVRIDPAFFGHYDVSLTTGFKARLTSEGRRSRIFRLVADREESERLFNALPELYWIARTLGPKPGASVLAEHPTVRTVTGPMPLVVTGRYGAGKLFFQATDDTWRWRRHTGELLQDAYWVQVVRELMPDSRVTQDRRFALRTDRRLYPYGTGVRAQVEIFDSQLLADQRDAVEIAAAEAVTATDEQVGRPETPTPPNPVPSGDAPGAASRFIAHRLGPESNTFEGAWVPPRPGSFVLSAPEIVPRTDERAAAVLIRVERPDLETRRPEANHDVLGRIAEGTGGQLVELDHLESAFGAIRDRSVQIPDDLVEPLWDSRLVLVLFAVMISLEWVLRKAFELL